MTVKRKHGRTRKQGVGRTASGAISRAKENVMQTATDARQRVYGVSEEEAPRQEAGTALGRLWGRGEITQAQMEAGLSYAEIHRACVAYEQCPKGLEKT